MRPGFKRREVQVPEPEDGYIYIARSTNGEINESSDLAAILRRIADTVNDGYRITIHRERRT